ncbi:MAG: hypothetical protein IKI22_03530 [Neisseriaceae bacterium]|nr:hypothetical protein [Neisseriaceae bacterium]
MSDIKFFFTPLLHIIVFALLLIYQQYWQEHTFAIINIPIVWQKYFATPQAKLLTVYMLLSPCWAIIITRKQKIFGNIVWAISVAWCVAVILFCMELIVIDPWLYWVLYATLMLFLGLSGVIFQIYHQEENQDEKVS